MIRLLRKTPPLLLLFLLAASCDTVAVSDKPGITGRYVGTFQLVGASARQQTLTLVLTESGGVVSGDGTLETPLLNFTVSGTQASSDVFLRWIALTHPSGVIEDTFEGRFEREGLTGRFRRSGPLGLVRTTENVVLQRQ